MTSFKTNKDKISYFPCLILFLFSLPFLGDLGAKIFQYLGKFYYLIILTIFMVKKVYDELFFKRKNCIRKSKGKGYLTILITMFFIISFTTIIFYANPLDNILFAIILLLMVSILSSFHYSNATINALGFFSMCLLYLFFFLSIVKGERLDYINPNGYASFSTFLFGIGLFGCKKNGISVLITVVNLGFAVAISYIIYKSETQLLTLIFIGIVFSFYNIIMQKKIYYVLFLIMLFGFVILLPIISHVLIKANILDTSIFTDRGFRWQNAIEALKSVGVFGTAITLGPHNGVLDLCLKYSSVCAVIFIILLFSLLYKAFNNFRNIQSMKAIFIAFCGFFFMNCVESFFVGLLDCYFMFFTVAIIISKNNETLNAKYIYDRRYCDRKIIN